MKKIFKNIFSKTTFTKAAKISHFFLNLGLFFSVLFLSAILICILTSVKIPISNFIESKLQEKISDTGYHLNFENLSFSMSGRIELSSPKFRFFEGGDVCFEAKKIGIRLSFASLLLGRFEPLEVYLEKGKLSPSYGVGEGKFPLENIYIRCIFEGDNYNLRDAFAKCGAAYLSFTGVLPEGVFSDGGKMFLSAVDIKKISALEKKEKKEAFDFLKSWDKACQKILLAQNYFNYVKNPAIIGDFKLDADGLRLNAEVFADEYLGKFKELSLSLKKLRCAFTFDTQESKDSVFVKFGAANFYTSLGLTVSELMAYSKLDFNAQKLLDTRLTLLDLQYDGMSLETLSLIKSELNKDNYIQDIQALAKFKGKSIYAKSFGDLENLNIDFEAALPLSEIQKHRLLSGIEELKDFEFRNNLFLNGKAQVNTKNINSTKVFADFDISYSNFYRIDADFGYGSVSYDVASGEFWAKDVDVFATEGWRIGGDVYQNLKNFDYRFLLTGTLRPTAINHFMEDWWSEIFEDTKFAKDFPYADFSVIGKWGDPEHIWVFGLVKGSDILRNDIAFERMNLKVWVNPSNIAILDANVENQGRYAKGNLVWCYFSGKIDNYDLNKIFIRSNMTKIELAGLGGPKVAEALEILDYENGAEIAGKIFLPSLEKYPDKPDTMNLDFISSGKVKIGRINLDKLAFMAYISGNDIYLDKVNYGIAKGLGRGSIFVTKKENKDWFKLDGDLSAANQLELIKFFAELGDDGSSQNADAPVKGLGDFDKLGVVNANFSLEGYADFPETVKGFGSVNLHNPKLAEINLLGFISKAANAVGFPLGAFDLKEALSNFKIEDGVVSFKDLSITGPAAKLKASVRYDFLKDKLYSRAILAPFESLDEGFINSLVSIANPMMSVLEIDMSGKISEPHTTVSIKPFNLFRSDKAISEEFSRRLLLKEENDKILESLKLQK